MGTATIRWWFYLVVPVAVGLSTLLVAELGLRLLYPIPYPLERNMRFAPDPHTGYRIQPHSLGHFQDGIPARGNAQGHRDDPVPLARRAGVPRLLVLGDSFTVGANVAERAAYPQVLERRLEEALGSEVEVVNSGVGGWDPFEYAQYFEHEGRAFRPDAVLIGFFVGNDTFSPPDMRARQQTAVLGRRLSPRAAAAPGAALKVALKEHSHLWRLLTAPGLVNQPTRFHRQHCDDLSAQYLAIQRSRLPVHLRQRSAEQEQALARSIGQIARIVALATRDGIPVLVALLPDENQLNPALQRRLLSEDALARYDFAQPQAVLRERFAALGTTVIDLLPAFSADGRCLYMNDTHWTEQGHALAAAELLPVVAPVLAPMLADAPADALAGAAFAAHTRGLPGSAQW